MKMQKTQGDDWDDNCSTLSTWALEIGPFMTYIIQEGRCPAPLPVLVGA
jgi:hypothetical protein